MRNDRQSESTQWISGWIIQPISLVFALIISYVIGKLMSFIIPTPSQGSIYGLILIIFWSLLLIFVWGAITAVLTDRLHVLNKKPSILQKNLEALELMEEIENGRNEKHFFVYLRSFRFEDLCDNWYWEPIEYTSDAFKMTTLDEELECAFELANIKLVCLGDTQKPKVGAARIETDDLNWRKKIEFLLNESIGILIFAGPTDSIVEEIVNVYASDKFLAKSVFIMAPKISGSWYSAFWNVILLDKLKKNGIKFPEHVDKGLIFNALGKAVPLKGYHMKSPIDFAVNIIKILENRD